MKISIRELAVLRWRLHVNECKIRGSTEREKENFIHGFIAGYRYRDGRGNRPMTKEPKIINPDCYVFREKDIGYITSSRHLKPDFVYGMSDEEINKKWEIYPVYFKRREDEN